MKMPDIYVGITLVHLFSVIFTTVHSKCKTKNYGSRNS